MGGAPRRTGPDAWAGRPGLARALRIAGVVAPFLVSLATAWLIGRLIDPPTGVAAAIGRWLVIAVVSTIVLVVVERAARRLLPLGSLLGLTLAFPDAAPSRLRLALRAPSTAQLRRRIEDARAGRLGDTPAEAAERVLELVMALSLHDRITRGHAERVRASTELVARELGLAEDEVDRLRWAGLLHDIGKLLVPAEILNKPGRLTDREFDVVKRHPEYGRTFVEPLVPWLGDAARAVWEHHEKWDGTGYPRGLAGTDISRAARIVAVTDCYDVMTSQRSYKEPVSPAEARAELARCAGSHFDPDVVRAFLRVSLGSGTRAPSWLAQVSLLPQAVLSAASTGGVAATAALGAAAAGLGLGLSGVATADGPRRPPAVVVEEGPAGPDDIVVTTAATSAVDAPGGTSPDQSAPEPIAAPTTTAPPGSSAPSAPAPPASVDPASEGSAPPAAAPGVTTPAGRPTGPSTSTATTAAPEAPADPAPTTVATPATPPVTTTTAITPPVTTTTAVTPPATTTAPILQVPSISTPILTTPEVTLTLPRVTLLGGGLLG